MRQIETLLYETAEANSVNILTVQNIKSWLNEYLEMREEDLVKFPSEREKNHWDLLVADYDSNRDSMFVMAYFSGETVHFIGSLGSPSEVRSYAENDFPENPDDILPDVERRFKVKHQIDVQIDALTEWLRS